MTEEKAFTLAEVLITLGIIGVVAALTLPTLIQNYEEKATVTKLKKVYTILNQAYSLAREEHGDVYDWEFEERSLSVDPETGEKLFGRGVKNNSKLWWQRLSKHMNIASSCFLSDNDCGYSTDITLDGSPRRKDKRLAQVILPDGITFLGGWVQYEGAACKRKDGYCGDFSVDINGNDKAPNKYGVDIFGFIITKNNIYPMGLENMVRPFSTSCQRSSNGNDKNGTGCTAWVIYNENMDYLHCDDLSWDGKTKCK